MLANISKWGNSLGIRIPLSVAKQIGVSAGEPVELIVEDNHILIQKVFRLDSLLARVTVDNLHSETDTGGVVGKEVW